MKAKVTLPIATWQAIAADPTNPLFGLSQAGVALLSPKNDTKNGNIVFDNIEDGSLFTKAACEAILAAGGEVYNYPIFASMTQAKFDGQVPEGIPGRTYTDDDGDEIIKTWAEWAVTSTPTLTDGTIGVPLQNRQEYIKGSEWITLDGVSGYVLLDTEAFRALLPQSEGE